MATSASNIELSKIIDETTTSTTTTTTTDNVEIAKPTESKLT